MQLQKRPSMYMNMKCYDNGVHTLQSEEKKEISYILEHRFKAILYSMY